MLQNSWWVSVFSDGTYALDKEQLEVLRKVFTQAGLSDQITVIADNPTKFVGED